jgi:hypothetical protein
LAHGAQLRGAPAGGQKSAYEGRALCVPEEAVGAEIR